jgi:hypothetical protein
MRRHTLLDDVDDLDPLEAISDTRNQLLSHLAAGIEALQHAAASLDRLRSTVIHDIEFVDGRDGGDVATFLDDSIRYGRAAYAVVHTVIDQETP